MQRRQALRNIIVVSAGAIIFPHCKMEPAPLQGYKNLMLNVDEFKFIGDLANSILPKGDLPIETPEPVQEFILNMVNDCMPLEDCKKYVAGLRGFISLAKEKYDSSFSKMTKENQLALFNSLNEKTEETDPEKVSIWESMQSFTDLTKRFTVQHFTGSDYFMTNHLDWQFLPGEYNGKVPV